MKFRTAYVAIIATLLSATLLLGCGGSDSEDSAEDSTSAPSSTGTPAESSELADAIETAQAGGTGVAGTISFDGPRPERVVLDTDNDPKCSAMHGDEGLLSDREIVNEDGGVQFAFVYIKNPPEGDYPPPTERPFDPPGA